MKTNDMIQYSDLAINPAARIPICLCLDTSGSMDGEKLNELNRGISEFYDAIRKDMVTLSSAELCIVTFGENVRNITNFSTLDNHEDFKINIACGGTPMAQGVKLALQKLEERKQQYKSAGVDYYQPWLVIMSDGEPDYDSPVDEITIETRRLESSKKLSILSVGIGNDANMDVLSKFSSKYSAFRLKGLNFIEFFKWFSSSIAEISRSQPGEDILLDLKDLSGWTDDIVL